MTAHDAFAPRVCFLVERDGDLVAAALRWKENQNRGWVKEIVGRESERGLGLGTALLHHGFREYARRGVERVGFKVDSSNATGVPQLYRCRRCSRRPTWTRSRPRNGAAARRALRDALDELHVA
jgi:ribosomal protein S18 acetylase RimI-like enzyme